MSADQHLQTIIYQITADLAQRADSYYIIYCRYYFFNDNASRHASVLFHEEHIFRVELLESNMLCDRMPASANKAGAFTIRIPYDQINKITKMEPGNADREIVLFIRI